MVTRHAALVLLSMLLIVSGMAPFVSGAENEYTITVDTEIDTPTRTFSLEGNSYTVDSMGKAPTGGELTFTVTTPSVDRYRIYLYNSERKIVEWSEQTKDGSVSFDTSGFSSGTYLLAVSVNGVRKTVQPVVVTEYNIEVNAPTHVSIGSSFTVDATLSGTSSTPEQVTVVLSNETWHQQYTASESDGVYTGDVPGTLATGEYSMYVTSHSATEVNGRQEATGISAPTSLSVTAATSGTATPPAGSGGGVGTTPTATPMPTPNTTTVNDQSPTPSDTPEPVTDTSATTTPPTASVTPTTTPGDNVLQPAPTTTKTTTTTMPGFPVLLFVLLLGGGAVAQLRSTGRR